MYGKLRKVLFATVLWFADLFLSALYALVTVTIFFLGFMAVVGAFDYPPHYSSLMIIGGMTAVFLSDWMMQNPPPSFLLLFSCRFIARLG